MKIIVTSSSNKAINADLVKSFHIEKVMTQSRNHFGIFADDVYVSGYVSYDTCKKAFSSLMLFLAGTDGLYEMEDNK